jgi:DNA-binding GntR family transcriptional regulator
MKQRLKMESLRDAFQRRLRDKTPKFQSLYNAFVDTLASGLWRPGDDLPTEKELAEALQVSGGTIQAFMRELSAAGIVNRRRGVGTTVAPFNEKKGDNWYLRFFADGESDRLPVRPIHIEIQETSDKGAWADFLGDCRSYVCIRRIMQVGDNLNVLAEFHLDGDRFRPLLDYPPEAIGNVHIRTILADRFRCPVDEITESLYLSPGRVGTESLHPYIDAYSAVLEVKNFSLQREPLIYQCFYIPDNPYRLLVGNIRAQTGTVLHG